MPYDSVRDLLLEDGVFEPGVLDAFERVGTEPELVARGKWKVTYPK
jgi:hypothetical protein